MQQRSTLKTDKPPQFTGWLSTDEEEISRRKWRGATEVVEIMPIDEDLAPYCDYRVESENGNAYTVEWHSGEDQVNSCECADFLTNRLGTCRPQQDWTCSQPVSSLSLGKAVKSLAAPVEVKA